MTQRSFRKVRLASFDEGSSIENTLITSGNSPRKNGKLVFRQNSLTYTMSNVTGSIRPYYIDSTGKRVSYPQWTHASTIALSWHANASERVTEPKALADEKLRTRYYSMSMNLLDLYRTRRETASMVTSRLEKIYRGAKAIKKFQFSKARSIFGKPPSKQKLSREFSNNWLEFQYGWRPLLGDIFTLIDTPFSQLIGSISAKGQIDYLRVENSPENPSYKWTESRTYRVKAFSRATVVVTNSDLSAASQVGVLNPLSVAWEAVPWSFVVDWFYPVGDYLERMGASAGLSIKDYSCTITTTGRVIRSYWNKPQNTNDRQPGVYSQVIAGDLKRKARTLGGFQLNPLPNFDNGLSPTRFANALALLEGVFSRSSRKASS